MFIGSNNEVKTKDNTNVFNEQINLNKKERKKKKKDKIITANPRNIN